MSYEHIVKSAKKTDNEKQLPWIEKYRPQKIDDIISHIDIISSLKKLISKKSLPHLLFFGPSGSGKTSTIKCCAKEIYGSNTDCMILILNASNERGIETVRTKIKNFVCNKNSIFLQDQNESHKIFKLVILDEIDSMTVEAQGMLRQTIEKNNRTTRFCLICNDIDKINIALQSRCALYRFTPLTNVDMKNRLVEICQLEDIKYENDGIDAIIKISHGDMRSAINILQQVSLSFGKNIKYNHIYQISGHCMPDINILIFKKLNSLTKSKIKLQQCIDEILEIVVDNNITIFNMLDELKNIIMQSKFNVNQKIFLIENFSKNEVYDSLNVDPQNIIMIISSLFVLVPQII